MEHAVDIDYDVAGNRALGMGDSLTPTAGNYIHTVIYCISSIFIQFTHPRKGGEEENVCQERSFQGKHFFLALVHFEKRSR